MWPFTKKSIAPEHFEECLVKVIERIESSEDSIWAGLGGDEVCLDLKAAIEEIKEGKEIDLGHLKMLFAPTGPIQEISMDNGWGDEYIKLSGQFDTLIKG